uniref:Uncharacterized protein n=1 Tax=Rhizophora mucronata TaxID=61149 RepID=A0A2P2NJ51_RHIMU
MPILEEDLTF